MLKGATTVSKLKFNPVVRLRSFPRNGWDVNPDISPKASTRLEEVDARTSLLWSFRVSSKRFWRPDLDEERGGRGGNVGSTSLRMVVERALMLGVWSWRILVRHEVHIEPVKRRLIAFRGMMCARCN